MVSHRRINSRNDKGNQRTHSGTARRYGQVQIEFAASVEENLSRVCRLYEITDIRLYSKAFLSPLIDFREHHGIASEIILENSKRSIHEILRVISTLALENIYCQKRRNHIISGLSQWLADGCIKIILRLNIRRVVDRRHYQQCERFLLIHLGILLASSQLVCRATGNCKQRYGHQTYKTLSHKLSLNFLMSGNINVSASG